MYRFTHCTALMCTMLMLVGAPGSGAHATATPPPGTRFPARSDAAPSLFLPVVRHDRVTPSATATPDPRMTPTPSPSVTPQVTASPTAAVTPTPTPNATTTALTRTVIFTPSNEIFENPERGFFWPVDLLSNDSYAVARTVHKATLVRSYARLDAYRSTDLPQNVLDQIDTRMAQARAAGVKIILRFAYNFGPFPNSEPDASKTWIKRHIEQLAPVLRKNADVIAWMEAGFIGAWGEWHTSTNGLDLDLNAKREILTDLLAALPVTRSVQLRYPADLRALYGADFGPADAYNGTDKSRVGHHNDCFLASNTDFGTYARDSATIEQDKTLVKQRGRYTPVSGETCNVFAPRSDCPTALAELSAHGWSSINLAYEQNVIAGWKTQGCFEEIDRRLGYRLALTSATFTARTRAGQRFDLSLTMISSGYAPIINERPVFLVLDGPVRRILPTSFDPRRWFGQNIQIAKSLTLPADLPAGTYRLALWLPDASPTLQADPRYAVRLANTGVWDAGMGWNVIGEVRVEGA